MFRGRTAWFSGSVERGIRGIWVREGGLISDWWKAAYLFSDDAAYADTKRMFTCRAYAEGRLTVFHSAFITACHARQSVQSVPIGHYVLPPLSVQREVKGAIGRFIWEQEAESTSEEALPADPVLADIFNKPKSTTSVEEFLTGPEDSVCCDIMHYPVNNMVSGYPSSEQLEKYSGPLHDCLPGLGYSVSMHREKTFLPSTHRTRNKPK